MLPTTTPCADHTGRSQPAAVAWPRPRVCALTILCTSVLAGCALTQGLFTTLGPNYQAPAAPVARWHAPVPPAPAIETPSAHGGSQDALAAWWRQFDDPALIELIAAAQEASANLAQAALRIARARADAIGADFAGSPSLDANAGANRSAFSFGGPAVLRSQLSVGLQSSWEIDLFGGLARQRESARAQLGADRAAWHDARVALAAEVANAYVNYRFCEMQVAHAAADATSRAETARLTGVAAGAGLEAPATLALSRAGAADAKAALAQRRAECESAIKALVALCAIDEDGVRALLVRMPAHTARLPRPPHVAIDALPARVLTQRPDIAAAEREVAVASAGIGVAEANGYPRLALAGNITPTRSRLDGSPTISVTTWSLGPSLTLPLFDGGRRAAGVETARAQYAAAASAYRARVRNAVREVEDAMVKLAGLAERMRDTRAAGAGYLESFEAARIRERAGLANRIEVENARRTRLAADAAIATLDYEAVIAWIALYRAVGGGWDGRQDTGTASAMPSIK